jgi:hypothetical protein
MKKIIYIYCFLFISAVSAQSNDITSLRFKWITYPSLGEVVVQSSQDYTSEFLVRWSEDKVFFYWPIGLLSFDTEINIPTNLVGQENEMKQLLSNAVSSWNTNYTLQMVINDYLPDEEAVLVGFATDADLFVTSSGGYAAGRTFLPAKWNPFDEQFEIFEYLSENENLTENEYLDVLLFSIHDDAPDWTTSITPTPEEELMLGTVILHELGHVLTMGHSTVSIVDPPRIMDNVYNAALVVPTLTAGDISNANYHYSKLYDENACSPIISNEGSPKVRKEIYFYSEMEIGGTKNEK